MGNHAHPCKKCGADQRDVSLCQLDDSCGACGEPDPYGLAPARAAAKAHQQRVERACDRLTELLGMEVRPAWLSGMNIEMSLETAEELLLRLEAEDEVAHT